MTYIIGIAGISGAGKSTTADILKSELNLPEFTLAHPVKSACASALGISLEYFLTIDKKQYLSLIGCTVREFMQKMGDLLLHQNPYALTTACGIRITQHKKQNPSSNGLIISDLRTEEECEWLRNLGGVVFHIKSNSQPLHPHRTEAAPPIKVGDSIIDNTTGDIDDLHEKVLAIADQIKILMTDTACNQNTAA
ncbi:deoxynucleotide monophosphate kinase family protein [Teredinibacter purpureus]|uniref:deoxynucleotide monophosphate kinase family protein n=1 Tax=Teredinibacter purpureus TaxID=2731756 RepID=UPI0005F7BEE9|nr:hypothetical protein [Teredinibacter purpureus]